MAHLKIYIVPYNEPHLIMIFDLLKCLRAPLSRVVLKNDFGITEIIPSSFLRWHEVEDKMVDENDIMVGNKLLILLISTTTDW